MPQNMRVYFQIKAHKYVCTCTSIRNLLDCYNNAFIIMHLIHVIRVEKNLHLQDDKYKHNLKSLSLFCKFHVERLCSQLSFDKYQLSMTHQN